MKILSLITLLITTFNFSVFAENLVVAFEPFPPFISADGKGLTVDMLREIEKISDFTFDIKITTYARAKHELKNNRIDIAGHTPKNLETEEFYQYGAELDWEVSTSSDLFSLEKKHLDLTAIKLKTIGTTTGNANFFAEQLGINKSNFIEVSTLNQLVKMLIRKRIDVILFERSSVMNLLEKNNIYGVFYQSIGDIPASFAVQNNEKGLLLKAKLDELIKTVNANQIFFEYLKYSKLSPEGKTMALQAIQSSAK
ncbi:MAG: substrate-binding periplasmic protein [Thalassotalea sp.]